MVIGIDVRHLAKTPATGVATVTRDLIEALARVAPEDTFRIFFVGRSSPPPFVSVWPQRYSNIVVTSCRGSNRLFDVRVFLRIAPKLDRLAAAPPRPSAGPSHASAAEGVTVWLSLHALPLLLSHAPRVLVMHDLSFIARPQWYSPQSRFWHASMRMKAQARHAVRIVAPSRATARDLMTFWKIPEEKIRVIPWGTSMEIRKRGNAGVPEPADLASAQLLPHRYVLFLGTVEKRKNILGLLRAFEMLKRDPSFADLRLVIAGAMGWGSSDVKRTVQRSTFKNDIELRGYVTEEEKTALLQGASVFVYPSFYEGFGLPVLEAMAAGVPVVTSHRTSLPEVAGTAALLVDPARPDEIADAMREILADPALSEELVRRGRERAARLSWETAARATLGVLREAAGTY